jgi:hypothetical protein
VENQKNYPLGWEVNSVVGDPKFVEFNPDPEAGNDYRLREGSPALGQGVVLPAEWEDPFAPLPTKEGQGEVPKAGARPDIGALPYGSEPLRVGRQGRVSLPTVGQSEATR